MTCCRVLLQFRAEETTINQYGGHSIQYDPQVDVEAVAELALMAGCPILSAADVVSFLVCLAGERIVEYFQWQVPHASNTPFIYSSGVVSTDGT